jgi:hypothetical protein
VFLVREKCRNRRDERFAIHVGHQRWKGPAEGLEKQARGGRPRALRTVAAATQLVNLTGDERRTSRVTVAVQSSLPDGAIAISYS